MTECQACSAPCSRQCRHRRREKGERTSCSRYLSGNLARHLPFFRRTVEEIERSPLPPEPPKKPAKKNAKKPVKKPAV